MNFTQRRTISKHNQSTQIYVICTDSKIIIIIIIKETR